MDSRILKFIATLFEGFLWPAVAWIAVTGLIEIAKNPDLAPKWYLVLALLIGSAVRATIKMTRCRTAITR